MPNKLIVMQEVGEMLATYSVTVHGLMFTRFLF